jgi:tyrosyl-tRNA synthetase
MGKSEKGAVFLDPALTSPYDFYQYWLNEDDALAGQLLRWLTLKERVEIEALEAEQRSHPERRPAQHAFAFDITARVHGREEAERQVRVAEQVFSGEPIRDPEVLRTLYEALDSFEFGPADVADGALRLAVASGTFGSAGEARRQIAQGGLSINDVRVASPEDPVPEPISGEWLVVRAGKKRLRIGRLRA